MTDWRGRMTAGTTLEFAAFIGLDWADAKHDICLQVAGSATRKWTPFAHWPEVIEAWATDLLQRFQGQPIAIALELNKGPIVEALRKYDSLVLFHINPMMLARYRQAFTPSRAKDDPTDAELQLELLLRHREKLKPLVPQSPEMRALAQLVEHRRRLVGDRVRITNRLISTLKTYFPHVLQWFPQQDTILEFIPIYGSRCLRGPEGPALAGGPCTGLQFRSRSWRSLRGPWMRCSPLSLPLRSRCQC